MKNINYQLYLVTDQTCLRNQTLEQAVEQAILGGVTLVQLREKTLNSKGFYQQALTIKAICQKYNVPLLINDRVDIALAVDADGVHIGQSDLPANIVRQLIGNDKIMGVSARTVEQALQAVQHGADYLGVGAMFSTSTKHDAKAMNWDELLKIRQNIDIPLVLIGGINEKTLPILQQSLHEKHINVEGFAMVSAILAKDDIQLASQQLKQRIAT